MLSSFGSNPLGFPGVILVVCELPFTVRGLGLAVTSSAYFRVTIVCRDRRPHDNVGYTIWVSIGGFLGL